MKSVYLARAGVDHYKVGVALDVHARMKALQTSNGNVIELVMSRRAADAQALEVKIHEVLQSKKLNGGREWFQLSTDQVVELAILINSMPSMEAKEVEAFREAIENIDANQDIIYRLMDRILQRLDDTEHGHPIIDEQLGKLNKEKADIALYDQAVSVVNKMGSASASMLQRRLRVGYARAARLMDDLETNGIIGSVDGARRRPILTH